MYKPSTILVSCITILALLLFATPTLAAEIPRVAPNAIDGDFHGATDAIAADMNGDTRSRNKSGQFAGAAKSSIFA